MACLRRSGVEAEVANLMEAGGEHMLNKATDELVRRERDLIVAACAERDLSVRDGDDTCIGDGDTVRVACPSGEPTFQRCR